MNSPKALKIFKMNRGLSWWFLSYNTIYTIFRQVDIVKNGFEPYEEIATRYILIALLFLQSLANTYWATSFIKSHIKIMTPLHALHESIDYEAATNIWNNVFDKFYNPIGIVCSIINIILNLSLPLSIIMTCDIEIYVRYAIIAWIVSGVIESWFVAKYMRIMYKFGKEIKNEYEEKQKKICKN